MKNIRVILLLFCFIFSTQICFGKSFLERMKNSIEKRYNKAKEIVKNPFRVFKKKNKNTTINSIVVQDNNKINKDKSEGCSDYASLTKQINIIKETLEQLYWANQNKLLESFENDSKDFSKELIPLINERFSEKQFKKTYFASELKTEYEVIQEIRKNLMEILKKYNIHNEKIHTNLHELETIEKMINNITNQMRETSEIIEKLLLICEVI